MLGLVIPICCMLLLPATDPQTLVPEQIDLPRLVDLCAERLNLRLEYDPAALKGTLSLRIRDGLSDQELWELTNRLLALRGFTSVEAPDRTGVISIVKLAEAQNAAQVVFDLNQQPQAGFSTVVTRVEHQLFKPISDSVKLILSKPSGTIADLGAGFIVISDLVPRLEEALRLIQLLDVPGIQPQIEAIKLTWLQPAQLVALSSVVIAARDAVAASPLKGKLAPFPEMASVLLVCPEAERQFWHELVERLDKKQEILQRVYKAGQFAPLDLARSIEQIARDQSLRGSGDRWKLIVDDLSGSILLTASPAEHEQVEALLERLRQMPAETRRPMRAVPIRNRGVKEIVSVLSALMEAGVLEAGEFQPGLAAERATQQRTTREVLPEGAPPVIPPQIASNGQPTKVEEQQPPGNLTRPQLPQSKMLTLTADEGTNTLIAVGDHRKLAQIEQLLRVLDVRQPQVMIEILVVSLSASDTLDLGVELQKLEISGNTIVAISSLFGLTSSSAISGAPPLVGGTGFTGVVLSPGDFSVVIRALQTINRGRSLNRPKVLVNNNQQATLDSVVQQPFASTNASTTVATTSFGGTQDAGTTVTIKPQIAEGDHLVLEYSVTLSSFVGDSSDPNLPPPRQSNNLSSIVTIPDGYTVVVGGLEITSDAKAISQIPLLGSIPVIGEAFKNRSRNQTRSKFFVFIRSEVMRQNGFEDLKYMSDHAALAAGVDDGWPEVEPRIIK